MTTPETLPDLKPCPFCGEALTFSRSRLAAHKPHSECLLKANAVDIDNLDQVAAWNRRADTRPAPASVLQWEVLHSSHAYRAAAPLFGSIRIERYSDGPWQVNWSVPGYSNTLVEGDFPNAAAAMDAADAYVAAALQPAPVSVKPLEASEALDDYLGDVTRHTVTVNRGWADVEPDIDGEWCRYEDVKANVLRALSIQSASPEVQHYSSCAVHNAPAYEPGPCDCGGYVAQPAPAVEGLLEALREVDNLIVSHGFSPENVMRAKIRAALAAYEGEKKDG